MDSSHRPVRIMRIIARLNIGGPALQAIHLTHAFNDNTFKSILVSGVIGAYEGDFGILAERFHINHVTIPELGRELNWHKDLIALRKLVRLIREYQPDIIHTHTAKAGTLGRIAAIITGVPVRVHTFHGHIFSGYFNPLKTRLFIAIERLLAHFTSKIIAISSQQYLDLTKVYRIAGQSRVKIIPLGLDLVPFLNNKLEINQARKILGLPVAKKIVTIVGRLVPVKNHMFFIQVAQKLHEKLGDAVNYVIVGDGELKGQVQQQAREYGLVSCVHFTGWRLDMATVYAASDVVVLTSVNEGTPVSLVEAMAAGKVVISTNVGGVPDVIKHGETGLLAPAGDVEQFVANLYDALHHEQQRVKLARAGQHYVLQKYTISRLINDIRKLYQVLLTHKVRLQ